MKKTIVISVLIAIVLLLCSTVVNAATAAELPDKLYAIGSKYGATAADKVKIERYIADNNVTDAQADAVIAKANEAAALMDAAGVTDPKKLSASDKAKLKSIANQAADVLGLTLSFSNGKVSVYKNGKLIDTISLNTGSSNKGSTTKSTSGTAATSAGLTQGKKLVYTGNNANVLLIGASIAGIALVSVVIRKKVVNV